MVETIGFRNRLVGYINHAPECLCPILDDVKFLLGREIGHQLVGQSEILLAEYPKSSH